MRGWEGLVFAVVMIYGAARFLKVCLEVWAEDGLLQMAGGVLIGFGTVGLTMLLVGLLDPPPAQLGAGFLIPLPFVLLAAGWAVIRLDEGNRRKGNLEGKDRSD